jgi:hypothetical protein
MRFRNPVQRRVLSYAVICPERERDGLVAGLSDFPMKFYDATSTERIFKVSSLQFRSLYVIFLCAKGNSELNFNIRVCERKLS